MSPSTVIERLTRRLFGSSILRNSIRGEVVEEIVAIALEPDWELCAGDWASCDLRHPRTKLRIQVKQSAARQSWHRTEGPSSKPRFSIAHKTGRWEDGDRWVGEPGRNADIFVFAWHPLVNETADHRDPQQWEFYVVAEQALPMQKSISLAGIQRLSSANTVCTLRAAVTDTAGIISLPS